MVPIIGPRPWSCRTPAPADIASSTPAHAGNPSPVLDLFSLHEDPATFRWILEKRGKAPAPTL